MVLKILNEF